MYVSLLIIKVRYISNGKKALEKENWICDSQYNTHIEELLEIIYKP